MSFRRVRMPIAAAALVFAIARPARFWAIASTPAPAVVELLSHGSWTENVSGVQAVHVLGRFHNASSTQTATDIHLTYDLQGSGPPIHSTAESMAQILGPGEIAPFDDVTFLPPGFSYSGTSLMDGNPASASRATSQPYHNASNAPLSVAIDPCPNPDPLSDACQNQVSGSVTNTGAAGVDRVRVMLTILNGSGAMVSADFAWAAKPDNTTYLAPNDSAGFTVYRSGEPPWSGDTTTGLVVLAEPSYPMDLNPAALNFGNQRVNQAAPAQYLTLTNKGLVPIHVSSIAVGGDFTVGAGCATIAAETSCTVPVGFAPGTMGDQTATLTITDDAAGTAQTIPLTGTGVASLITFGVSSVAFGQQRVNTTSATKQLTVTDSGTAPLTINAVNLPADFTLTDSTCPAVLDTGTSCTLTLAFTPSAPGARGGNLTLDSDALNPTAAVSLSGEGVGPVLVFDPTALSFGTVTVNTSSSKQVTLTNSGFGPAPDSTLTITSITLTGDYSRDAGKPDSCGSAPITLAVGHQCSFNVLFTPTQAGTRNGTLKVRDSANVDHVLSITGQGAGTINMSPSAINFSNQQVGTSSPPSLITLSNGGSVPIHITSITAAGDYAESDDCPATLPATSVTSCTISVRFLPTGAGARAGTLTVVDDAGTGTQTTTLNGNGVASDSWEPLGGFITSGPASSSWGANRVDVFVRGGDNAIWHRSFDGATWSNWDSLGGLINADPAAVSSTTNRIDLFVRGLDGALWTKSWVNGVGWGIWTSLGGRLNSAPSVTSMGPGLLDVVALGTDNALWQRSLNGTWGAWHSLGGLSDADPAAVASGSGHLEVFVRGLDHALWHRSFINGSPVGTWQSLGGLINSAPRAASATPGHIDVFALGGDNALWHRAFDGASWGIWQSLGGRSNANPSAVGRGSGVMDLFVRGTDFALWHRVLSGT